jgi:hypothetical protein
VRVVTGPTDSGTGRDRPVVAWAPRENPGLLDRPIPCKRVIYGISAGGNLRGSRALTKR